MVKNKIQTFVNSVLFNKENYYILSCIISNQKVSVIGQCPYPLSAGDEIFFTGNLRHNPKYGTECKTDLIEIVMPTDKDMIINYLQRAKISGLGGATAEKIYNTFGKDTFKIIDEHPERLLAVSGIGRLKMLKIIDCWKDKRNGPRIIDKLISNYNLSIDESNKIYDKYKDKSLIIAKESPFVIYQDELINFHEANAIHRIEKNDPLNHVRLISGIIEVLRSACSIEGHCSMPTIETINKASRLLNVSIDKITETADTINFKKMVKTININNVDHLQLFSISKIEHNIASKIHRMLISKNKDFGDLREKVDYEIKDTLDKTGVPISDEQREAIFESLKNNVNVINGGPGVGKTTIANQIIKIILKNKYTCTLLAPTGRAAKRMTETTGQLAKTIHRLIAETEGGGFKTDFIIVDEFSMVDIFILDKLLSIIDDETNLIIIGDADQIMSIGAGCVLRDIIESGVINISRVNKIRRQGAGSNIISNAYKVNSGEMIDKGSKDDDFMFIETDSDEKTSLFINKMMERNIQSAFNFNPKKDVQILTVIHGGLVGTTNINKNIQKMFYGGSREFIDYNGKRFYVGDNVIQNVNDYERMVFNGDVGYIKSINNRSIRIVYPDHSDDEVIYRVEDYNQIDLSYAITPFKAQGSEFPVVIIPISHNDITLLDSSLLFTAITRGASKVIVLGSRKQLMSAIKRNRSKIRHTTLKDKLKLTFTALNNQMHELIELERDVGDVNDSEAEILESFIIDMYGSN